MFLVSDTRAQRRGRIESFEGQEIIVGVLLSSMDFEWTIRRAILALGWQKNATVRKEILASCHGVDAYKRAWASQVTPRFKKGLPDVVPRWSFFRSDAYPLRHRLIHGVKTACGVDYARCRRDAILSATDAVLNYACDRKVDLYKRLPVRKKDLKVSP